MATTSEIKYFKVNSLPPILVPDAVYFVNNPPYTEMYVTDALGNAKGAGNSEMITSLINTFLADFNTIHYAANITARDALAATMQRSFLVLVFDASDDPLVESGSALYAYNEATDEFTFISDFESQNLIINYTDIQGRPTSSPANIDDAVAKRHEHNNLPILQNITASGDVLDYNGFPVMRWEQKDW